MPHIPPNWTVDYTGAIQVEAAQYGYLARNNPKAWCLHTPEEVADKTPSTPYYFHNTTNQASTHYYVAWTGLVFQMVPEKEGAYANVREMGQRFSWEDITNLNLQTLNVEIEGFAHNIHITMPRGGPQWRALVMLLADRCQALGFPIERMFGHKQVSPQRSDPGSLRLDWLVHDVNTLINGEGDDDMPTLDEIRQVVAEEQHKMVENESTDRNKSLRKLIKEVVTEETDSKRPVYRFKDKDGNTWGHIFHLDSDNARLVHEINPQAYLDTGSAFTDAVTLQEGNKDHEELLRLPVFFPKGLTQLADHLKKR